MKLVIFGLTVSSSWGNGHATLWRGLCRALVRRGHRVVFFEKDAPYYAGHRDLTDLPGGQLILYSDWETVVDRARCQLDGAEVGMVTSSCPDGIAATELVLSSNSELRAFYDLDTPITLDELQVGRSVIYVGPRGLCDFDLVLSYTGGAALEQLKTQLGARRVAPLYGSVDPAVHHPVPAVPAFHADLSYLGTYSDDRQEMLDKLFIRPAQFLADQRFLIGGALYPEAIPWQENVWFSGHVAPPDHSAFFCSSRLTLSVTRGPLARMGYCPSSRLFAAASCGTAILSDRWEGLDTFFEPGKEILVGQTPEDAVEALQLPPTELRRIAQAARERTLAEHTADQRVRDLEIALSDAFAQDQRVETKRAA